MLKLPDTFQRIAPVAHDATENRREFPETLTGNVADYIKGRHRSCFNFRQQARQVVFCLMNVDDGHDQ